MPPAMSARFKECLAEVRAALRDGRSAPEAGLTRLKDITRDYPEQSIAWRGRAEHLWQRARQGESLAHFRRALLLDPEDINATRRLGLDQVRTESWATALPFLKWLHALDPSDTPNLERLGRAHFKLNHLRDSRAAFQRLLETARHDGPAEGLRQNLRRSKAAFIHLPKTGGTSVERAFARTLPSIHHRLIGDSGEDRTDPYYAASLPSVLNIDPATRPRFFTNIRNIFSLLVSHYQWSRAVRWFMPDQFENNIAETVSFEDYVRRLADRETPWPSRHLLNIQMFAQPSGLFAIDWINRLENLGEDIAALSTAWNLPPASIGHENANTKGDYRRWYSDTLIELVNATWHADITLFGFTFDGYRDGPTLHRDVAHLTGRLRYRRECDLLEFRANPNDQWALLTGANLAYLSNGMTSLRDSARE